MAQAGYMGLAAAMSVPMGAKVPILSPNDHATRPRGYRRVSEKDRFSKIFGCRNTT